MMLKKTGREAEENLKKIFSVLLGVLQNCRIFVDEIIPGG